MASWKGYLKLSLVACPIRLYPATTETEKVRFHLINPKTGNRIAMRVHDAETGEELERSELVKGCEYERKRFVTVSNDELKNIRLESTKTIDIERFVDIKAIDPAYFETPYFVVPDGKVAAEAYTVIREAMREQKVAGIGRVVLSAREHPLVLREQGKGIVMTTLRTADELRDAAEYFDEIPGGPVDKRMVEMAMSIIGQMKGAFDPATFQDRYQEAVRALVESKLKGMPRQAERAPERTNVINLMDALKRSLGAAGAKAPAPSRKPAARTARAKRVRRKAS